MKGKTFSMMIKKTYQMKVNSALCWSSSSNQSKYASKPIHIATVEVRRKKPLMQKYKSSLRPGYVFGNF